MDMFFLCMSPLRAKNQIKKNQHRRILEEKTGWCNVLTSFILFDDYGIKVNHHIYALVGKLV